MHNWCNLLLPKNSDLKLVNWKSQIIYLFKKNACILTGSTNSVTKLGRRFHPRNSKFCVQIPKVSVMDIDVQVAWISKRKFALSEVSRSRHIGHQLMIPHTEDYGPRTEGIHKRQVISEEKVGVSLVVSREFSLSIQLGITDYKQSR